MALARSLSLAAGLVAAAPLFAPGLAAPAHAQPADNKVLAEQLFAQGRALAKADNWTEACPKFEASLRYDPTLGTRLNLATCYEKTGKLASAWGLFRDAAELARGPGEAARREYALQQAAALLPRLPRLTIKAPPSPPAGFAVTRDGVALDLAALGSPLYVDPGPHEVVASAPGFEPQTLSIEVREARTETLSVPALVAKPEEPAPAAPIAGPAEPALPPIDPRAGRTRRFLGLGVAGGGLVLAGVGLVLGASASSTYDDAKALCGPSLVCEDETTYARGQDLIDRARSRATVSTVLVVAGAAAVAAGAVVWVTAPRAGRGGGERREAAVVPVVSSRDLGLAVAGRF